MAVRTRYAPSPTGEPHLGNVRTALFDRLPAQNALALSRMSRLIVILASLALAVIVSACGGGSGSAPAQSGTSSQGLLAEGQGGVYLALGDSLAAATGASQLDRGYVERLRSMVEESLGVQMQLENLAAPGATTQALIDVQLSRADELLRQGDVRLVTIDIGGNDFAPLFFNGACLQETPTPDCPLLSVLQPAGVRIDEIFRRLRAAGPEVPIVIMTYPNLFSGSGHAFEAPAERALSALNEVIREAAARYDVVVAEPAADFDGKSLEFTHIGDTQPDFHPNDTGHAAIADAFLAVLSPEP